MAQQPRRIFAGEKVRGLRNRLALTQSQMAERIEISVSYLSQIENNDRPMTDAVLMALSREFPNDWAEITPEDNAALLAAATEALSDPAIAGDPLSDDGIRMAIKRQPRLAERIVSLHAALRRSQEQLRTIDDALDRGGGEAAPLPWDEVRDWFHAENNYIDTLDRAAERIAEELATEGEGMLPAIRQRLHERHGVRVTSEGFPKRDNELREYDPVARLLLINRLVPLETQQFQLAHQLVRMEMIDLIGEVARRAHFTAEQSRTLLEVGLANYAAGALLMPYGRFRASAREVRHDIDALRTRFGVSFEQVCHRLSTLQRPGASGVPFFFCRVDMAGNITKRHSATPLQFARYGGACPLWIVHEAVAIPDRIAIQLAETPDGIRYVSMAKGIVKPASTYATPPRRYAVALGCEVGDAKNFVYADELDLSGGRDATPIGVSCRICPRSSCSQRAFPPVAQRIELDPDRRTVVPYRVP
ncbi:helix-turn-helix domain-containing protein [Stakelama marina]|uniref:DUF2083 domain-containing protein n=1 Tax=Stakelama marina TaxID=2826939 RepID=A0A8T4IB81_9SPHN|nr:helix-turn-helix transcriptional regulator [Stakelama marina]MBR0551673.1 DUF2083 domain-containing protein [Stakelama marina]